MDKHIQMTKENLHEILRQTWNREISADDALELLEDILSEVERLTSEAALYKSANADVKRIAEERNEAKAEVERLRVALQSCYWEEEAKRYCSNSQYWRQRAEQAEAEVERLKEKLASLQEAYLKSVERDNNLTEEIFESKAEVERLKAMVTEAARLGDSRASNFKDRAEKAEFLLTQIQAFTEALNPKIK